MVENCLKRQSNLGNVFRIAVYGRHSHAFRRVVLEDTQTSSVNAKVRGGGRAQNQRQENVGYKMLLSNKVN